jgi:hypothetical protein
MTTIALLIASAMSAVVEAVAVTVLESAVLLATAAPAKIVAAAVTL